MLSLQTPYIVICCYLIDLLFKELNKELIIKDSKYNNEKSYLEYLKNQEKTTILFNKISNYISNNLSINVVDRNFNKLSEELSFRFFNFQKELGSETNRIFKNESKLKK